MPEVSVVVCTLNRAPSLDRALFSLGEQGATGFEVIVVDNGCTDATAQILAAHRRRAPNLSVVLEPRLGLSAARNRGVGAATGDVVAFLDDDAEAGPDWVGAMARRFSDPGVDAVGGRVDLVFPRGEPPWLPERLRGHYAGIDLGPEPRLMEAPKVPYGTNMAIRRARLEEIGAFATSLGRRGRSLISNEEVDLFARLRARGAAIWYEPAAVVHHHIELERSTRRYLARRAFAQGRSRVRQEWLRDGSAPAVRWTAAAGAGWALLRRTPPDLVRAATATAADRPRRLMDAAAKAATRGGVITEALSGLARR